MIQTPAHDAETITVLTRTCMYCNQRGSLTMTPAQLDALDRGVYVQDALADMDRPLREQFISGTHPVCWTTFIGAFPADEDDDEQAAEPETVDRFGAALEAFGAAWEVGIGAYEAAFALWEPDVDADQPDIGIARLGAEYDAVVRVTLDDVEAAAVLRTADTGERIDLARAARMLALPAPAVRTAIDAATAGLRAAHHTGR